MRDRWAAFMADQEWADIKKRTAAVHGPLVGKIEERVLQMMDYSPGPKRFIPLAGRPALRASRSEAQTVRIQ